MTRYEYIEDGQTLLIKHYGSITKDMIFTLIAIIFKSTDTTQLKRILSDYRSADLKISSSDLKSISQSRDQHKGSQNVLTVAFLTGQPNETALTQILSNLYRSNNNIEVFTSIEGCQKFLKIKIDLKILEDKLENLKNVVD